MSLGVGLRAKELCSLRWIDVFEREGQVRNVLHLKAAYTKGAKIRDVFLSAPKLRRALEEYHSECRPWDFNTALYPSKKGGNLTPTSMARFLKQLYQEAGIPKASSHSGRRTMITQLAEKGIDLKAISALAGHSNVRTTALYVENNPSRLARILQEMTW
jgi:integrase/recombinase XerD